MISPALGGILLIRHLEGMFPTKRWLVRRYFLVVLATVMLIAFAGSSNADDCAVLDDFSTSPPNSFPAGWKPRDEAGKNVYVVMKDGDMFFVRARATDGKSSGNGSEADRPVKWNLEEYPILSWKWRPRVSPRGANEQNGKDDSALGVYIGFCPPDDVALCERAVKGQLGLSDRISLSRLYLTKGAGSFKYIWSEQLAKGLEFERGGKSVKVLEHGPPANRDRWVEERVNVAADYRKRFGSQKLLNPVGISILTDSDDTQTVAEGDYADFKICRE
jgi:hypothetical protein